MKKCAEGYDILCPISQLIGKAQHIVDCLILEIKVHHIDNFWVNCQGNITRAGQYSKSSPNGPVINVSNDLYKVSIR